MGHDIHGVFQRYDKATSQWHDVSSSYDQGRDYQLFAILAGVRKERFISTQTGYAVEPIAEPRGLPDDFKIVGNTHFVATIEHIDQRRREFLKEDEELKIWMGEHSYSWLTGDEMLDWFKEPHGHEVVKTGILDRADYDLWDGVNQPTKYCGGISGPQVVMVNDDTIEKDQAPNWTHIRCKWQVDLRTELAYFFDEVERLVTEHGQIRFVFGFDS